MCSSYHGKRPRASNERGAKNYSQRQLAGGNQQAAAWNEMTINVGPPLVKRRLQLRVN